METRSKIVVINSIQLQYNAIIRASWGISVSRPAQSQSTVTAKYEKAPAPTIKVDTPHTAKQQESILAIIL